MKGSMCALLIAISAISSGWANSGYCASLERQSTVDGTQYAVIAPTYSNPAGTQSYFRLFNGSSSSAVINVTVVGGPSGNVYGTKAITIPAYASPQFSLSTILSLASAGPLTGGDDSYALYLKSAELTAGYQHVTFNGITSLFSNSSTCGALLNDAMIATSKNRVLTNVHTSQLSSFPSTIYVHNYRGTQATYRLTVIDAGSADSSGTIRSGSGAVIGIKDVVMSANATYATTFAALETAIGWSPTSSQVNANVIVSDTSGAAANVLVSQAIINPTLVGPINMATACAINNPNTTTASTTTTFAGTLAGKNGQTGTLSVTVQTTSIASASTLVQSGVEKVQSVAQSSGVLVTGGATINLTGSYDSSTAGLTMTGGGYAFSGAVSGGAFSGSYTGPSNGDGAFSALNATQTPVTRYCGNWNDGQITGTFNVQISANGSLTGDTYGGKGVTLNGQKTGTSISGTSSEGVSFSGTVLNGSISGTFVPTGGGSGVFTGGTCS
jgi:hypothetical protein